MPIWLRLVWRQEEGAYKWVSVSSSICYGSFGESIAEHAELGIEPVAYGFAGREWDSEAQLYYNRARMFNPETGRFLTQDPSGRDGPSFYRALRNNPLRYTDAKGLYPDGSKCWDNYSNTVTSDPVAAAGACLIGATGVGIICRIAAGDPTGLKGCVALASGTEWAVCGSLGLIAITQDSPSPSNGPVYGPPSPGTNGSQTYGPPSPATGGDQASGPSSTGTSGDQTYGPPSPDTGGDQSNAPAVNP
jgi:RHS repeat-associated protein